jgi:uncharacterized protein (TIGR03435 family)
LVLERRDGKLGPKLATTKIDCARIIAERQAGAPGPSRAEIADKNAPVPPCVLRTVDGRMEGDTTMAGLGQSLAFYLGRTVVDKTGLSGFYHVTIEFDIMSGRTLPTTPSPTDNTLPSVFTALSQDLGLKVESSHADRTSIVIDRIERPTQN